MRQTRRDETAMTHEARHEHVQSVCSQFAEFGDGQARFETYRRA